jgi:hypothetical protein
MTDTTGMPQPVRLARHAMATRLAELEKRLATLEKNR